MYDVMHPWKIGALSRLLRLRIVWIRFLTSNSNWLSAKADYVHNERVNVSRLTELTVTVR
jgi:hypothetical protein